jgi:uncharacterized C2H2 Zn-finger protein
MINKQSKCEIFFTFFKSVKEVTKIIGKSIGVLMETPKPISKELKLVMSINNRRKIATNVGALSR